METEHATIIWVCYLPRHRIFQRPSRVNRLQIQQSLFPAAESILDDLNPCSVMALCLGNAIVVCHLQVLDLHEHTSQIKICMEPELGRKQRQYVHAWESYMV
ncbi:hypothetical protein VNO77_26932 [Canavalia gladiata]|uniref:Uncharacterized protein n=1 Tax=Canavalia gladiata TaxID=3824 RepID=A0AAN9KWA2_CANGL